MAPIHPPRTAYIIPNNQIVLQNIADHVEASKSIVVIAGAGISTNLGIPVYISVSSAPFKVNLNQDFRSRTGIYKSNRTASREKIAEELEAEPLGQAATTPYQQHRNAKSKRNLFHVSSLSDPKDGPALVEYLSSLRQKARASRPTITHQVISGLNNIGKLMRCYTQNIDGIEQKVGLYTDLQKGAGTWFHHSGNVKTRYHTTQSEAVAIRGDRVEYVQLHGSLQFLRCVQCGQRCNWDENQRETTTLSGQLPACPSYPSTSSRGRALSLQPLRPDIVLYGEQDPQERLFPKFGNTTYLWTSISS